MGAPWYDLSTDLIVFSFPVERLVYDINEANRPIFAGEDLPTIKIPQFLREFEARAYRESMKRVAVVTLEISDEVIFEYVRDRRVTLAAQIGSVGEL